MIAVDSSKHLGGRTAGLWRKLLMLGLLCGVPLGIPEAAPQAPAAKEYEVKAVFLLNFAQFVEWPDGAFPSADTPLAIGILGEDPFGAILDRAIQGEKVKDRTLAVKRFKRIEDVKGCHLLFISRSERTRVPQILSRLGQAGILTVGETERFAQRGGIINFVLRGNKIALQVNTSAAARNNLKISSKLLRLVEIVGDEQAREGG